MYLSKRSERDMTGRWYQNNEHEHRSDDPVVERCRQRCILHENQSRLKADFREEPYRTQVQYHAAPQWEDDQLNNDKGGDLFQLLVSLVRMQVGRG